MTVSMHGNDNFREFSCLDAESQRLEVRWMTVKPWASPGGTAGFRHKSRVPKGTLLSELDM